MRTINLCFASLPLLAGGWTEPAVVRHDLKPVVSYRAAHGNGALIVEVSLEPGWHTFSMDNEVLAAEKLAGKKSLGLDQPTAISLSDGLEPDGGWTQSAPKDFSRPELRWYAWGFENKAYFSVKTKKTGAGPAKASIRAQACTDTVCKNIDLAIPIPLDGKPAPAIPALTPVRR